MGAPALDHDNYTLADLETWDDGNKYELVHGRAVMMGGAGLEHGRVVCNLYDIIRDETRRTKSPCLLDNSSSIEVVISQEGEEKSRSSVAYLPDLILLCDKSKIEGGRIFGGPEFIAEVLSHSTFRRDLGIKRDDYERVGVREYWVLDYKSRTIQNFNFASDSYIIYKPGEIIRLEVLSLDIQVDDLFPS